LGSRQARTALVTGNERHVMQIAGMAVENWIRGASS
jgi:hypothetical protein